MPKITNEEWKTHQEFERDWHNNCANSFSEEAKQLTYAHRMGLQVIGDGSGKWPVYDLEGKSVIDIGGGPYSILLKCINRGYCLIVDPCEYPKWVNDRYDRVGIKVISEPAESFGSFEQIYDEAWCYNCLQHTMDPEKIIKNMRGFAKKIRIFEWIDTEQTPGHPHILTANDLNTWLHGTGTVEQFNGENGCYGRAYYGVFECASM